MGKAVYHPKGERQKIIIKLLNSLEGRYSRWDIWQDFIVLSAVSIANADAPIKMPPDEEEEHPGSVAVSFTAAQPVTPVPAPQQQARPQVQPQAELPKTLAPEPPKTVDEYLQVMTVDQAKMVKIDFGKFSGWTLGDIAMKSPGDLAWYVKNYSGHNLALKAGAMKLLEAAGQLAS